MSIDTAIILAGGKGTRIKELTHETPKPMLMVGDRPILHHIMDIYVAQGVRNFIIPVGYLGQQVFDYVYRQAKMIRVSSPDFLKVEWEDRTITVAYTGLETQTGGRLLGLTKFQRLPEHFHFTYGDGLSDVPVRAVEQDYILSANYATLTAVHPVPRFGAMQIEKDSQVVSFGEKKDHLGSWINGGYGVLSRGVLNLIDSPQVNLEKDVFSELAKYGKLGAYKHEGFWMCIDTLRDLEEAEKHLHENGAWK